ncbi:MAG: outer membrane beta-barrel domain-containing protein [Myxococcales bacterium]
MTRTAAALIFALLPLAAFADAEPAAGDVQRVHVVEKRPFTESGRTEVSVFAPVQVNSRFTRHAGISGELAYHLRENLAVQLGLTWYPLSVQSGFSEELANKVGQAPTASDALLLQGDALLGVELMPIYGKLDIFDGKILRLGFYLNAGLGAAKTRLQLRSSDSVSGRSFGDAGIRPAAGLGGGFRVFVNDRFTVRLELRDRLYSAYVSRVNGCGAADATAIHQSGSAATGLSTGCSASSFGSNDSDIKGAAASAESQLRTPSATVVNNLAFQGGVSWLF